MVQIDTVYVLIVFVILVASAIYRVTRNKKQKYFSGNEYLEKRVSSLKNMDCFVLIKDGTFEQIFSAIPSKCRKGFFFKKTTKNKLMKKNRRWIEQNSKGYNQESFIPVRMGDSYLFDFISYNNETMFLWKSTVSFNSNSVWDGIYQHKFLLPKNIPLS